jgi:hypothetical protein
VTKRLELFELEMLGDSIERRYRQVRPDIDKLPWGTLDMKAFPARAIRAARYMWTSGALQEHQTAAMHAITLRALIEARTPVDLTAVFSRFVLDEVTHADICARMAAEVGGGVAIRYDPDHVVVEPDRRWSPMLRATDLILRVFCVGEAFSGAMLKVAVKHATRPLPRAALRRILRDEAAHGTMGYVFLDWALPRLAEDERAILPQRAALAIDGIHKFCDGVKGRSEIPREEANALGWIDNASFLAGAARAIETDILEPLRERSILTGP